MREINLVEHPFKRRMERVIASEYRGFGYDYFDSPRSLTGFRGYGMGGSAAEGRRNFLEEARAIAAILGVRTVLDVGCAKGYLVKALRALGVEAFGADVSEYAVNSADADVRGYLRVIRAQDVGSNERYDLVHVSGMLVYLTLSEIESVLKRFHEIARIGIVVSEPTREQITQWYEAEDVAGLDPLRKQELFQAEWDRLIAGAGFDKEDVLFRKRAAVRDASCDRVAVCPPPVELHGG